MASMLRGLLPTTRPTRSGLFRGGRRTAPSGGAGTNAAGFSGTNLCCWILPCSSSRPWNSASGRGGQPGMYTSTGTILSTPLTTL